MNLLNTLTLCLDEAFQQCLEIEMLYIWIACN